MTSNWKAGFAALSVVALATIGVTSAAAASPARPSGSQTATAAPPTGTKVYDMYVTFYGWFDNTPPGCGTAYDGCAGGVGTYKDPITFASDKAELPVGTIIYYPTLQKYFKMEDSCGECTQDWSNPNGGPDGGPGFRHVDLWLGGKGGSEFDAIDCEDALTQGTVTGAPLQTPVMVNPPSNQPVSTEPIFNVKTGHCFGGQTTSTSFGQYSNGSSHECIEDQGNSSTTGSPAVPVKCTGAADQDLTFNGAFFMVNKLCLNAANGVSHPGSKMDWATCTGGPDEQWSINGNGTLSTIQTGLCLAQSGSALVTAKCTTSAAEKWVYKAEPAP
ncbi:MAG TPA: ricin-type beta-trefoil lectin domain protein [Streptosporangiaceae bacterium]|nr:ricin-type beta-trefoil lectin domain protein [Streptosporangiaceae bacterium]